MSDSMDKVDAQLLTIAISQQERETNTTPRDQKSAGLHDKADFLIIKKTDVSILF